MQNITPEELNKRLHDSDTDEVLLDVRSEGEYDGGHIEQAENIPLDDIEEAANRLKNIANVYVTCGSGVRSQQACNALAERGVNVVNVEGGVQAWEREGFGLVGTGKKRLPIIRQVLITAGSLVLIGTALGYFFDIRWLLLSGIVGSGLLFAGLTGICFMAMFFERMPWNK